MKEGGSIAKGVALLPLSAKRLVMAMNPQQFQKKRKLLQNDLKNGMTIMNNLVEQRNITETKVNGLETELLSAHARKKWTIETALRKSAKRHAKWRSNSMLVALQIHFWIARLKSSLIAWRPAKLSGSRVA